MTRVPRSLAVLAAVLTVGCDSPTGPELAPTQRCGSQGNAVVTFADPQLAAAVSAELGGDAPTCNRVGSIEQLAADGAGIADLAGAQNLTGLTDLLLPRNAISDVTPLSGLTRLQFLDLQSNQITDISAFSGLTSLLGLSLARNQIVDVSPLGALPQLTLLGLDHNNISDVSALGSVTTLSRLVLFNNNVTDISSLSPLIALGLLDLGKNPVPDIGPIANMFQINVLGLEDIGVTDLSPLGDLLFLAEIVLTENTQLNDIQPLIDNVGVGRDDLVHLQGTNVPCTDVALLEAKRVTVLSEC